MSRVTQPAAGVEHAFARSYRRTIFAENLRVGDQLVLGGVGDPRSRPRRQVADVSVNRHFGRVYIHFAGGGNATRGLREPVLVERQSAGGS